MWKQKPTAKCLIAANHKTTCPIPVYLLATNLHNIMISYHTCISAQPPNRMPHRQSNRGSLQEGLKSSTYDRVVDKTSLSCQFVQVHQRTLVCSCVGRCNNGNEVDCSGVIAVDGEGSPDTPSFCYYITGCEEEWGNMWESIKGLRWFYHVLYTTVFTTWVREQEN